MATTKPKKVNPEQVTAIRFHLEGKIEISYDRGETWTDFDGIVINAALIEYNAEID